MYKLIAFDLDDTLTQAKTAADLEMISLLVKLLEKYKVAIITWWAFDTINTQIISLIKEKNVLNNLFIFPTIWTKMYFFDEDKWNLMYTQDLEKEDIDKIFKVLNKAIQELKINTSQIYWEMIENRWSQVTFSALWQKAPLEIKRLYDPDKKKRQEILEYIKDDLKNFSIWIAWTSSIDITKKWFDKSYGILQIMEKLYLDKADILFVWDALFKGWNDYPIISTGIDYKKVENPEDTKNLIRDLLNK